jgi:hypothetical protein
VQQSYTVIRHGHGVIGAWISELYQLHMGVEDCLG